jgi:putative oxidoreductase
MSRLPPDVRSRSHGRPATDGGRGLLLGGPAEVFAYANQGVGGFTKLGMPMPEVLAPAIAVLEIGGGLLLMSGLGTRLISVPFLIEMLVAILSDQDFAVPGHLPAARATRPAGHGGWAVLHEIRSEYAQIMTCIYLLAAGPGPWSLDALLLRRHRASAAEGSSATFPSSALRADSGRRRPRQVRSRL